MKILIVGGGIAGITLGYFLQKNHNITIIEKSSKWRTIGYGIGIWKNGLAILNKLPLASEFWDSGCPVHQGATLSSKGDILFQMSFEKSGKDKPIAFTFEREILHCAINTLLGKIAVRFNTTIAAIVQSVSGVEVAFNDGTKEKFDLVVGADGVRSTIRSLVFGDTFLKSYGWNIWGTWIPADTGRFQGYYILGGANESLLSFPYHERHAIGLMYKADETDWPKPPLDGRAILDRFPLLQNQIKDMIPEMDNFPAMFCDKLQYVEMDKWYKGRVVLIGDARHGMSPLTGMGTSLALEDGFVLAEELNATENIEIALGNFAERRNKRLQSMKTFRNIVEKIGMVNSPTGEKIRNLSLKAMPSAFPDYLFGKIFDTRI
jgi:2-polyprenyl-6-methoxyphenol hydroxylase-like FAD-dependent oxidoreductase